MKVLLTGAGGQLGSELKEALAKNVTELGALPVAFRNAEVIALGHDALDITDRAAVISAVRAHKPRLIVNCAAYTKVDQAQEESALCMMINAGGAENLAVAAREAGALYVLPSTESVFGGGVRTPYTETDEVKPQNVYGKSKLEGERRVLKAMPEALILRAGWLYGYHGKNFVKTMLVLGSQKESIKVVNDQYGNPTNVEHFLHFLFRLLDAGASGVFHCADAGVITRYIYARAIIEKAGFPCRVLPCMTAEFTSSTPRSDYMGLSSAKMEALLGEKCLGWQENLERWFLEAGKRGIVPSISQ